MRDLKEVFEGLNRSDFRSRIRLGQKELAYLNNKGMDVILGHAADFIEKRLAPAHPVNDGKQTPWRNHPVFVAQHATATCCRGCLEKWHTIPKGRPLESDEKRHIIEAIRIWLSRYEIANEGGDKGSVEWRALVGDCDVDGLPKAD
jgi:hypothetical protein